MTDKEFKKVLRDAKEANEKRRKENRKTPKVKYSWQEQTNLWIKDLEADIEHCQEMIKEGKDVQGWSKYEAECRDQIKNADKSLQQALKGSAMQYNRYP